MTVATTKATYETLYTRLLTFQPTGTPTPDTLADGLTGGLWVASPPEDAWDKYPFGVMRLVNRQTGGEYDGIRETADLEVLLYHRGVTNRHALESLADTCDEAMLGWFINSGPAFSGARQRDTFEQPSPPAQRDVVVVRLVYQLVVWPGWLTKYSL